MNLNTLRKLVKEELSKVLNQGTFHNGEKVLYNDNVYLVKSDGGNIGVEIVGDDGKTILVRRNFVTRIEEEN